MFIDKLKKVDKTIVKITRLVSNISGVCLIIIMLVAFFNVIGEKARTLGMPVSGIPASTEIIQYLHIPVVFLSAAFVTFDRGHVKIDLLSKKLPEKVRTLFKHIGNIFGGAICAFISYRGVVQMIKFIDRHKMSSVSGAGFPLWPFALIMSIGFAMLTISFFWNIVRHYINKDEESEGAK